MILDVMSQNCQIGAREDGRWEGLVRIIREVDPDVLLLQEVDWLTDADEAEAAREALAMDLFVSPSRQLNTAVAWKPDRLERVGTDTRYSTTDLHHGYCGIQFQALHLTTPWPAPLTVISTHLTPYSTEAAAIEAQLLVARAYRFGGIGLVGGDINHKPLGDEEPPWSLVPAHNRAARCLPRENPDDPWFGNPAVGRVFREGDMADAAAHLADQREDPQLRLPTGKTGRLRVDQIHVTPALVPTIANYRRVDPGEHADHFGTLTTLDLARTDLSAARPYA